MTEEKRLEDRIPLVNWPTKDGKHFCVQFKIHEQPKLLFSSDSSQIFPAEIIQSLLERHNLPFTKVNNLVWPDSPICDLAGLGFCELELNDTLAKFAHFREACCGASGYFIGLNQHHLREVYSRIGGLWTFMYEGKLIR